MHTDTPTAPQPAFTSLAQEAALSGMAAKAGSAPSSPRKRINSQALLGSEREIEIEHGGQLYRLRLTALGKLILTK